MGRRNRSYFDISGRSDSNLFYIGAIIFGAVFLLVVISSYKDQQQCDATIMAKLYDTYSYLSSYTDDNGDTRYKTVYGGRYKFEALGETYTINHDSGNSSPNTVSKELKVAYFSDDPSVHMVYTAPVWYFIGGGFLVIIILYGFGGLIFKW